MEKIGNIFLLFLLFVPQTIFASEQKIVMQVQDMQGELIEQAMSEVPFILQVEVQNIEGYNENQIIQNIPGIERLSLIKTMTSQNISIYNGKKICTLLYHFVLKADAKGVFELGPLCLKNKSNQITRSNQLTIHVGDELLSLHTNHKSDYFVMLKVDKKQAYVGEKIQLIIQFYDSVSVDDLHLEFPEFKKMHILKTKDVIQKSRVEIEGKEYILSEWSFDVYPTHPGSLILQDIYAAFFWSEPSNKFGLGGAFHFFQAFHKSMQRIAAKPIKIEVLPLPHSDRFFNVNAVGQFSNYNLRAHQSSACVGQGISLTIELVGDGNFEMISLPELILPKNFNYYDSHMVVIDSNRNSKQYECVMQAEQPGSYTIQPQLFVYFDPVKKQYVTLQSDQFDISIAPALHVQSELQEPDDQEHVGDSSEHVISHAIKTLEDFSLIDHGPIHVSSCMMLSFSLFQNIIGFLLLIWFCLFFYVQHIKNFWLYRKMLIFYTTKNRYTIARKTENIQALKAVFDLLFAQLIEVTVGQLSDTVIINYMKTKKFSEDFISDWSLFYMQMLQASFSVHFAIDKTKLFTDALQWIERLKEKV